MVVGDVFDYNDAGVEKAADGSCAMTVESISQSTTLAMAATLGIKEQLFAGRLLLEWNFM